jgi:2-isopropylmalate synthase
VKINVNDEIIHTAADGNGPVNALDTALRKALAPIYPSIHDFQLVDYKVRILHKRWSTVGASTNIIEASWHALADSIEYGLAIVGEGPDKSTEPNKS